MSAAPHEHRQRRNAGEEVDPAMARAEELVDQMGQRVGHFLLQARRYSQKAVALAREEAEDIWAEAQHIRRNGAG